VHYDPLLAKLIASGETREIARRRAVAALQDYPVLGVRTNLAFLAALLSHDRVARGDVDTTFLDEEGGTLLEGHHDMPPEVSTIATLEGVSALAGTASPGVPDPWQALRDVRV
jgi:acetyl-CoA/propionyl-CoA carboxylase biotin carboxyl carrier protein